MAETHRYQYLNRQKLPKDNANEVWLVAHNSLAKERSANSPFLVPNEWVSARLASFLCLPVPPFVILRNPAARKPMFASMQFGGTETRPPDLVPRLLVKSQPSISTGIIVFDILVMNQDRNKSNLKVDNPDAPTNIAIIDHERALFEMSGPARFKECDGQIVIAGKGSDGKRWSTHCLTPWLNTGEYFSDWTSRVQSIPDWYITDVCSELKGLVGSSERLMLREFLRRRRDSIVGLIEGNREFFPKVKDLFF